MQLQLGRKTLFTGGLHIHKSLWSTWWAKYIRQPLALTSRMTLPASAEFCIWLITPLSLLGGDYSRKLPLLLKPTIAVVKFLPCISRGWGRVPLIILTPLAQPQIFGKLYPESLTLCEAWSLWGAGWWWSWVLNWIICDPPVLQQESRMLMTGPNRTAYNNFTP